MNKNLNKKNGLSLVEIMVVIAIISAIALISFPVLFSGTNVGQYQVLARKTYAELQQAVIQIGETQAGANTFNTGNDTELINIFLPFFNSIQTGTATNFRAGTYRFYGTGTFPGASTQPAMLLNNNVVLNFQGYGNNCAGAFRRCGEIGVELNGTAPPNRLGVDFLAFYIIRNTNNTSYSLVPRGINGDGFTCLANSNNIATSLGCTALMVQMANMP